MIARRLAGGPARRRVGAAVTAVLLARAAAARADAPRIDLARCAVFDDADARRAVDAELAAIPPARAAHLADVAVVIACPDAVTVTVTVTPAPADGALAKTLDLGDLPADLRLRGVALAVAELVDAALDVAAALPPPPPPPAAAHGVGGVDAAPFEVPRAPPGEVAVRRAPRPRWSARRALVGATPAAARAAVRGGVRVFLDRPAALTDLGVEVARGPLALDLFFATARADDPLGGVRALLGGVGVVATVGCRGAAGTWLCAGVRGAAGAAAVTVAPIHPAIVGHDAVALYLELGPRFEIRVEHRRWSASLTAGVAWSSGLAALAQDREVVRLGGPVVTSALAVGWGP